MTPFLGLLLILLITFIGVQFQNRTTILRTPLFSGLIVSGIPYILIGVLLGPNVFNFLNQNIISSLEPLISLAIGWVGLLFGLQLRLRNIRRYPQNYLIFTSLQSLITFILILIVVGLVFYFSPLESGNKSVAVITLAALGSITAPLSIARIAIEHKIKGRLTNFIQFISSLDAFWGIIIAGLAMAIFHIPAQLWIDANWEWIFLSIALGILVGILFRYLIRLKFQREEVFLLVFGLVIFTSGIGFYLQLSPILMTMIVGITLAQFPRESEKVMRIIHIAEKPTYLFMLIYAGALWNYRFWEEIAVIIFFIGARFFGKYLGGWISSKYINCGFNIPPNIGKTLLSFGGVSLAIALNFQLFYGSFIGDIIMSATILGILIFDEYSAISILNILKAKGEEQ
jgi:hypothetical protein